MTCQCSFRNSAFKGPIKSESVTVVVTEHLFGNTILRRVRYRVSLWSMQKLFWGALLRRLEDKRSRMLDNKFKQENRKAVGDRTGRKGWWWRLSRGPNGGPTGPVLD